MSAQPQTLAIVGPTASGKSSLAMELARHHCAVELVSADSMQVYRGMDIGTAKPSGNEQAEVRHHLIDIAEPSEDFNVSRFQMAAQVAIADVRSRGKIPVLVGGTGLYLRSVIDNLELPGQFPAVEAELKDQPTAELFDRLVELDPEAAGRMEPTNHRRVLRALTVSVGSGRRFSSFGPGMEAYPQTNFVQAYIDLPRPLLYERIELRYQRQVGAGFVEEVRRITKTPGGFGHTAGQALGYREILRYLADEMTLDDALDEAIRKTRRFARRQQRWFRRDPRLNVHSANGNPLEILPALLEDFESCI